MSDYIRREDAIRLAEQGQVQGFPWQFQMLVKLHPADVVPVVHGEWVDENGNKVKLNEHGETCGTCFCNRCGEWLVASDEYVVKGYFCPNCGADMRGKEER